MRPLRDVSFLSPALLALTLLLAPPAVRAQADAPEGKLEVGLVLGGHFFANDVELGVPDLPDVALAPRDSWLFGARVGYALLPVLTAEGELVAIPTRDDQAGKSVFVLGWRANGLLQLPLEGRFHPFLLAGVGALSSFTGRTGLEEISDDTDFVPHWGAGVKVDMTPRLALRVDLRHLLPPSTKHDGVTNDFEVLAGLSYRFGGSAPRPPPPPVELDSDGDGLMDGQDKCPSQAEDKDGFQDEDGCADLDNDGDGVADAQDTCPLEAETANGVDDQDGCSESDDDGDGLLGSQDRCPSQAEDKDGFQDEDGCADADNDGDGIADAKDACPTESETWNGLKDEDGCADELPKAVARFTGAITGIRFQPGSDQLQEGSFKLLDDAIKVLKEFPDVRLEISGHTSSDGDRAYNVDLSKRRAETVKQYMVSKGVDAGRITTLGLGPDRPVASNDTPQGREQNRRIEFRIINAAPGASTP